MGGQRMASASLLAIEKSLKLLCTDRAIPIDSLLFFGSQKEERELKNERDVDVLLISPAFEGKDVFQRSAMMKGIHRSMVKQFKIPFDIVLCSSSEWEACSSPLLFAIKNS
jgi:hypothetical protein